ncbi:MAG: Crp/Fnr family transcriptional regulator [Gammaproteobacteria bacterium]|nr:Crp/Fnr family transcriptional regulator [Gammaproteobacteria bacterium]
MKRSTKHLLDIYRKLPDESAQQLIDFAEFLASRVKTEDQEISAPEAIERPATESVVAAVKRLSATYPMLDKDRLLNETAALVSAHMLQGRDAVEVIDELEVIFCQQYDILIEAKKQEIKE